MTQTQSTRAKIQRAEVIAWLVLVIALHCYVKVIWEEDYV